MTDNTPNIEAIERLEAEYEALKEKLDKLETFLVSKGSTVSTYARGLMVEQYEHMHDYAEVLRRRYNIMKAELAEAEAEEEELSPNEQLSAYEESVAEVIKDIPTPDGTELHAVNIKLKRVPASDEEDMKDALDKMGFVVLDFRELF